MSTEHDFAMAAGHAKVAPHPERFDDLPARSTTGWNGWTDEQLAGITTPMPQRPIELGWPKLIRDDRLA